MLQDLKHPVILFDGVCNLCNASVQYVIEHDPTHQFRFGALQGRLGQELLQHFQLPASDFNSFVLLQDGKLFTKSTAALKVLKQLKGGMSWMYYPLIVVPIFIRDFFYSIIARNRYKWFGREESCWLPTPELMTLFYD